MVTLFFYMRYVMKGGGNCITKSTKTSSTLKSFSSCEVADEEEISFVRKSVKYINNLDPDKLDALTNWSLTGSLSAVSWAIPTHANGIFKITPTKLHKKLYPLLQAIYNAPTVPNMKTIYRGLRLQYVPKIGTTFRHRMQPFSTSISSKIAYMFGKTNTEECVIFDIRIPIGTKALYLDHRTANAQVSPHDPQKWYSNDEYELLLGYYDVLVRETYEDTKTKKYASTTHLQKPCWRVVCDIKPCDVYIIKKGNQVFLTAPSYCDEGVYEAFVASAEIAPLVIDGELQGLPIWV